MTATGKSRSDSQAISGGCIASTSGEPAFTMLRRDPSPIPVLIAVPHGGRTYPDSMWSEWRQPRDATIRLEDRLADELGRAVAERSGASLLTAHAPRAIIDLNRASDDVDWSMVDGGAPAIGARPPGRRVRSGLGLVPRRLPGLGELWSKQLQRQELQRRIAEIHEPYHAALADELAGLKSRWGAALLLDLHSMPPIAPSISAPAPPDFVAGDRFGASCSGAVSALVFDQLTSSGWQVAHNRPYAGGYVLDRHSAPRRAVHALQIEVCRSAYLDEKMVDLGGRFDAVSDALVTLVRRLGAEIASFGSAESNALAAE